MSDAVPSPLPKITISIITRRRVEGLSRVLDALADAYGRDQTVRVLVVDNDEARSSETLVTARTHLFTGRLEYVCEPQKGYSSARNTAVANRADADYVLFIDDDEIPHAGWIAALLAAQRQFNADVVAGRVRSVLPPDAPRWLEGSDVFDVDQPNRPTGSVLPWCATNNTLVARRVFDLVPSGFDRRFDETGGEDCHFFMQATRAGCRIIWMNDALVSEQLGRERLSFRWILRRAMRSGNTRTLVEQELVANRRLLLMRFAKACGLLIIGTLQVLGATATRNRRGALGAAQRVATGFGMLAGFIGLRLR